MTIPSIAQGVLDGLTSSAALIGADGQIIGVNRAWREFARLNGAADGSCFLGQNYIDVCRSATGPHRELAAQVGHAIISALEGAGPAEPIQYPCDSPDQERWFELRLGRFDVDGRAFVLAEHRDVTLCHGMMDALTRQTSALQRLVGNLPGMVYRCEPAPPWPMRYVSEGATALTGYNPDDFVSGRVSWADLMDASVVTSVGRDVAEAVGEDRPFELVYEIRHRSGTSRYVHERGQIVRSGNGEPFLEGFVADITALKTAEQALDTREATLAAVFNASPFCIKTVSADGRILQMNRAGQAMLGRQKSKAEGRDIRDFVAPESWSEWEENHNRILAGERRSWTFKLRNESQGEQLVESVAVPLELPDGGVVQLAITRDISDEQRSAVRIHQLESELVRVMRARSMAAMGAAIAHELNQPLGAAANYLNAAQLRLAEQPLDNRVDELVASATSQLLRAGDILRDLREFVKGTPRPKRTEDLLEVVTEALSTLQLAEVRCMVDIPAGTYVRIERLEIQQVIVNLVKNAIDAIGTSDSKEITIRAAQLAKSVRVEVVDNGPGFPAEALPQLFEAFISTKEGGLGVGLGICRMIVEAHGGRIRAEKTKSGACVSFTIPQARQPA